MKNPDEDIAYGEWKQRQIDSGRLMPRPYLVIGSALPQGERIQKSVRKDPHPEIPFTVVHTPMSKLEKAIWASLIGFWLTLVIINSLDWAW